MHGSSTAELKAFEATARTGSMSAAARLLGLRQPTVSAHLSSLEQRYGVELFHRKGRGVELSEFGRLLHEVTARLYQAEEQARLLLLSAKCQYQGHLHIGAVGPYNILPLIRRFREHCAGIRISVALGDSREITRRVLEHHDDVGLVLHAVDDPAVHCVPYRKQKLVVFAPVSHPLARQRGLRWSDLAGQEFVLREDGSRTRSVFEAGMAEAGITVRTSLEMGSREAVREAVAQGLGLGVVAHTAFVADARLTLLNVDDMALYTHAHLICLEERKSASLISRFFDQI
ncbi:MAG: LysR family transcriptional regulator [Alcanivorax sp.]|nr:LysR family transcriptional regulator [Alcanivorax sp.]